MNSTLNFLWTYLKATTLFAFSFSQWKRTLRVHLRNKSDFTSFCIHFLVKCTYVWSEWLLTIYLYPYEVMSLLPRMLGWGGGGGWGRGLVIPSESESECFLVFTASWIWLPALIYKRYHLLLFPEYFPKYVRIDPQGPFTQSGSEFSLWCCHYSLIFLLVVWSLHFRSQFHLVWIDLKGSHKYNFSIHCLLRIWKRMGFCYSCYRT